MLLGLRILLLFGNSVGGAGHVPVTVDRQHQRLRNRIEAPEGRHDARDWQEGQSLVFDDTFPPSIRNDTNETRVVLFLDIMRPCRRPGTWGNQAVMKGAALTPFIKSSRRHELEWEARFREEHGGAEPSLAPSSVADTRPELGSATGTVVG